MNNYLDDEKLIQRLNDDVHAFIANIMPVYVSLMPDSFFEGIVEEVVQCPNFSHGDYNNDDIRMGFEREIASRYGIVL